MSDPYWDNVALLLHCDGANNSTTFTDEKGKVVTALGNAKISTTQSKFGGASGYFDGTSHLSVPTSSDFDFGAGSLTFECWLRPTAIPSLASDVAVTNGASNGCGLRITSSGKVSFIWNISGVSSQVTSSGSIPLNEWSHVAGVRDGTDTKIFLNGVLDGVVACGAGSMNYPGIGLSIGRNATNSSWYYTGYIDEVRITKGVARYTSSFTPPTGPFPSTGAQPLIDAIASGQLLPSPLSQMLVDNWPRIAIDMSGSMLPTGSVSVFNPQPITAEASGAMKPTGFVLVSAFWLIEAVASGRMKPSEAAHILIDNLDPGQVSFAQILGEIEFYSEMIRSAQIAGKMSLIGEMAFEGHHQAEVAGIIRIIDTEAAECGCGNG